MLLKLWGTYNVGVVGEHSVLFVVDLMNVECLDVNLLLQHDSFVLTKQGSAGSQGEALPPDSAASFVSALSS